MFDIKIIGSKVLDGTGAQSKNIDIGITDDEITEINNLSNAEAKTTINAEGKYVCPGFIDAHSHSDAYLLIEPSSPSKIYQGITTEIVGNCGASAAPLVGKYQMPSDWRDKNYPGKWNSVSEYRELLEQVKPAPNVVLLIGHTSLRVGIAGYENRPVTSMELKDMGKLLEKSLDQGGRGLSTGLIYAPASSASKKELTRLAEITAKYGGIYTSHMRSEGKYLLESINETISIGKATGVDLQISHLKTSGRQNWDMIDDALAIIEKAGTNGINIAADRYPYTSACTDLDVIFPAWAEEGGLEETVKRLKNHSIRARLRNELVESRTPDYWSTITIGSTSHPDNKGFRGMPLPDVASCLNMDVVDALLHILEKDKLKTSAFFFGMSDKNMLRILAEPYVMIGTDASLRSTTGDLSMDYPHPRAYGSFPRFLRMAFDGKTVPPAEAVRKMTSLPAKHFSLKNRGLIARGKKADIIIFDSKKLKDMSSYTNPHQFTKGIDFVIINGKISFKDGYLTNDRAGRIL